MTALLDLRSLSVDLPTEDGLLRVVDDVSFTVAAGEIVGVAGESGSGKTMTALAILGLLPRAARVGGQIVFRDRDLVGMRDRDLRHIRGSGIAMVFQEPMTSMHPAITVGGQIVGAIRAHERVTKAAARARAVELLRLVGLPDPQRRVDQYPHELSGGMQQRAMIAMALSCEPDLLIADEPTTALDVTIQLQIVELIQSLQADLGLAVMFVSHDLGLLAGLCDRVVVLYAGHALELGPTDDLFTDPQHPYTAALLAAAPHPDYKGQRLPTIAGSPPRAGDAPHGCRFAPRCEFVEERCRAHPIALESTTSTRAVRCIRHDELDLAARVRRLAVDEGAPT
jgi:oligopeptide/dipeptide ABC transporter ATP-binding protein